MLRPGLQTVGHGPPEGHDAQPRQRECPLRRGAARGSGARVDGGELPEVENKPPGDDSRVLQITWTTLATAQRLSYKCPPEAQEVLVNYLPLSYIGAQLFDVWVSISVAGALYFAQPDALRVSGAPGPSAAVGAGEAGEAGGVGGSPSVRSSAQDWDASPAPTPACCVTSVLCVSGPQFPRL